MQLNPYLLFNGNCADAFKFYEKCLGGKIVMMMTHEGTPAAEQVPANWREKIIHARMTVGDHVLMGSDAPPDRYAPMKGFAVSLHRRQVRPRRSGYSRRCRKKASVGMPMQQTFFAVRFGMVVDQFGTPWMITCEAAQ